MRAIVRYRYGAPDVLRLEDVAKPVPAEGEVLVRVVAASLNPLDVHFMTGSPSVVRAFSGLRRPKVPALGADVAGRVEAIGGGVTRFKPGDDVYGAGRGTLAEYASLPESRLAPKPSNLSFEEAATVPVAGCTALQALREKGSIQPGQAVLVNGAAGGVGTFAVQIARSAGARVTGVCSTRNLDLVRSIGAETVVDYTREDFTALEKRWDLIVDCVANHPYGAVRRVLSPAGTYVVVGGSGEGWVRGLFLDLMRSMRSRFVPQKYVLMLARIDVGSLVVLTELIEAKKVAPVIDRTYPLSGAAEGLRYLGDGHARGKVVVTVRHRDGGGP
jgi:NADPH:quinone reductase-like Zn-dependent oxidoreductase